MPYYVDKTNPEEGQYDIEETEQGFRWIWTETAKGKPYYDCGQWHPDRAAALSDAADDWENNGSPSSNRRLAGTLRALATRSIMARATDTRATA